MTQGALVSYGGELGVADDLRLEPVGQYVVDVVADQIAGDGANAVFRFEDIAGGSILLLDGKQVFGRPVREEILEGRVELSLVAQGGVGSAAFVENLQGGPVLHGIH